ncbi:aldehyde ferredoxin oxidoreductase family protein [Desulfurispora thermophila]|uniref:aldehyde ferredoxin oxidoreductase family protein n=1 Tax=Desulfurispora thermophila TaxID=265470 RepID=UPI00036F0A8E|nr:aldehyde ferredoxin oxidoreductase family protein [Desulfurispora thermophila]
MGIYQGDLVYVNLSTGEVRRRPCAEEVLRAFLGGRGLATYILLRYLSGTVAPLAPENILVLAPGLLGGSRMITTGRLHIAARSPLTGLIGSSNGGGKFAARLRALGIVALVVTGRAERPVYIRLDEERVSIEDATALWGLKTHAARQLIKEREGEGAEAVLIGPAGENLSALGCVATAVGHAAGRTGMGAVMGSKHLKAVVISAAPRTPAPPREAVQAVQEYVAKLKALPCWPEWTREGSASSVSWTDRLGAAGVKNFNQVTFEGIETACGSAYQHLVIRHHSCYNCPVHCRAFVRLDQGRHAGFVGDRGEYEPLSMWGPRCGNADGRESIYLCNLCDEYGIDSFDAGCLVAFAMDLYERGILTREDTDGLELTWGNVPAMEELLLRMVYRRTWLGDALSRGLPKAAVIIGRGAEKYAYHVKGLGLPIMDPRGFKGSALGYAVLSRGADFNQVYAKPEYAYTPQQALAAYGTEKAADRLSEEGKARMVKQCMCANAALDALGICRIPAVAMLLDFDLTETARVVAALAGEPVSGADLLTVGERIVNAERLFNFRCGASGRDDRLPEKFLREPVPEGPCRGQVVRLDFMLQEFYALMGWEADGTVGPARQRELGLAGLDGSEDIATIAAM